MNAATDARRRQETAEKLKDVFLIDLSKLCGRAFDPDDELTKRIYEKARAQGLDVAQEVDTSWVASCSDLVQEFRQKIPNGADLFHRIVRVTKGLGNADLDAITALEWAEDYLLCPSGPNDLDRLNLATCLLDCCFVRLNQHAVELPEKIEATALAVPAISELETHELETQANLGKSIRVLATVLGALAFLFTKAIVIFPLVLVAWVMAYTLIDNRAIKAAKERLALTPGEKPKT